MPAKAPPTVRVRYVGPIQEVDVPGLGLVGVKHGDVVEVPPEAAGRGPFWRPVGDDEPRLVTREYRETDKGDEVRDLGSGLCSQVGNWELVDAKDEKAVDKAIEKADDAKADEKTGGDA